MILGKLSTFSELTILIYKMEGITFTVHTGKVKEILKAFCLITLHSHLLPFYIKFGQYLTIALDSNFLKGVIVLYIVLHLL